MIVFEDEQALRAHVSPWKNEGQRIAFVPTMGFLHEGHLSLLRLAKENSDKVICSIFVNPTQFNQQSDLNAYPQDREGDLRLLKEIGVDLVYTPTKESLYGKTFSTWVEVKGLSENFEGADRAGHFRGVTTVVSILFQIVRPDVAIFGEKDFQQLRIIEQMVADLHMPIEIMRAPLVREEDGLALSSRNVRLSTTARSKALLLSQSLHSARKLYQDGERDPKKLKAHITNDLKDLRVRYVSIVDERTLQDVAHFDNAKHQRVLLAADVDGVRLLDNMPLT